MKNKTMLVLCIAAMIMFLPLYRAAIPANEIDMTRALDNSSSNICFTDADCNGHGQCINGTTCVCDKGWTTYSNMGGTNKSCLYDQRSKLTAFLVSFFVGTLGVDWFYLSRGNAGYIVAGVFKLLMGCGCCGGCPFFIFGAANGSEMLINIGRLVSSLFSLGTFVWWIVDWARILAGKFPDGNGVGLKPF